MALLHTPTLQRETEARDAHASDEDGGRRPRAFYFLEFPSRSRAEGAGGEGSEKEEEKKAKRYVRIK